MKRHLLLNIVLPALALLGIAVGITFGSYALSQLAGKPTEEQLQEVSRQIENNELSPERQKQLIIELARSRKATDQSASEFLRATALAIVFFGGWLVVGCFQVLKKAQQAVPADVARPAGSARA